MVSIKDLQKTLMYDHITGELWRIGYGPIRTKTNVVYVQTAEGIQRVSKLRVVFALHNGRWPRYKVTPIDGDKSNMRIKNLVEHTPLAPKFNLEGD